MSKGSHECVYRRLARPEVKIANEVEYDAFDNIIIIGHYLKNILMYPLDAILDVFPNERDVYLRGEQEQPK